MSTVTLLAITASYGEPNSGIQEVLYEFLTNAMDANPTGTPTISVEGTNTIVIADNGRGIAKAHFETVGRINPRNPNQHGSHGSGLKESIACCIRKNWSLKIETLNKEYTFEKANTDNRINLIEKSGTVNTGTRITISNYSNAITAVNEVKTKFLPFLLPPTVPSTQTVEVYELTTSMPRGAIFINGVRKFNHPTLQYIYNFPRPSTEQKESITRNHTFAKKAFARYFRNDIEAVNPSETFGEVNMVPTAPVSRQVTTTVPVTANRVGSSAAPATTTPQPSVTTRRSPTNVYQALLADIHDHCMDQDYHVWTITTKDRDHLHRTYAKIASFVRTIDGLSVASTFEQGSLAKNTFVPLSSDIDMIVKVNNYTNENKAAVASTLKTVLRQEGARLEDSGNRIINFTYDGVAFDLVLQPSSSTEVSRTARIANAEESTRAKLQSFIRAVKYWAKRCGLAMKSCCFEEAILNMWADIRAAGIPFLYFLTHVATQLRNQEIVDFYEINPDAIQNVENAAAEAKRELLAVLGVTN